MGEHVAVCYDGTEEWTRSEKHWQAAQRGLQEMHFSAFAV